MELTINGQREALAPCTLAELVARKGLDSRSLVVELNGAIIKQEQWPQTPLTGGDRLELLSFVGGG